MKLEAYLNMAALICGLLLMIYGAGAALRKVPVAMLYRPKDEKSLRKEYRFHAIGYGGMGFTMFTQALYFFFDWEWAGRLSEASRTVLVVYLLYTCTFRIYVKGYIPGDSIPEK